MRVSAFSTTQAIGHPAPVGGSQEEAFLLVTDLVGLQHLLSALCARHNGDTAPRSMVGTRWRAEWIVQPRDRTNDAFPSPGGA